MTEENMEKPGWFRRHKVLAIVLIVVIAALAAGYGLMRYEFKDKAALHTKVAGVDVGGMTESEIEAEISEIESGIALTLTSGDTSVTATAADLGMDVDAAEEAAEAVATGSSANPISVLFTEHDIALNSNYDEAAIEEYVKTNFPDLITDATEPTVVFDSNNNVFSTTAGSSGKTVNLDEIYAAVEQLEEEGGTASVEVTQVDESPVVSDENAQAVADQMNTLAAQTIEITNSGTVLWTVDPADIADWAVYTINEDTGTYDVSYDQSKVEDFINTDVADQIDGKPVDEVAITDDNNNVLQVISEGSSGLVPDNVSESAQEIISTVEAGQGGQIEITTTEGEAGIEAHVASGGKWIEYNRTTYTVTLHEGDTVYWSTDQTADGKASTPTITGLFSVLSKVYVTDMPNPPSTEPLTNIHYVTYWEATGYAFHEAWWLTQAKIHTGISHGCVNMWLEDAKTVYDFAEIGMPVWVHD